MGTHRVIEFFTGCNTADGQYTQRTVAHVGIIFLPTATIISLAMEDSAVRIASLLFLYGI